MKWTIEIKNYRCFSDSQSLEIDLSKPVISVVGPNNSGKSAILKFFWELGAMLALVPSTVIAQNLGANNFRAYVNPNIRSSSDPYSILCQFNDRPLIVDLHQHPVRCPVEEFNVHSGRIFSDDAVQPISLRLKINRSDLNGEVFLLRDGKEFVVSTQMFAWHHGASGTLFIDRGDGTCFYLDHKNDLAPLQSPTLVPAVRSFGVKNAGSNASSDLLFGQDLIANWNAYKQADSSAARALSDGIEAEIAAIFGYQHVSIIANNSGTDFIFKVNNEFSYNLRDMGTGISQFLTILFYLRPRGNQIVLIDEPETGIHASLQVALMSMVARYANGPVIFATHSVGLARSVGDQILSLAMHEGQSRAKSLDVARNFLETLGELSFSAWREIGCDRIVFVEGVHDVKVLREWLRLLGREFEAVVLPLGGSEFIRADGAEAIRQVLQVHPRTAVIIDSEIDASTDQLESKREFFVSGCKSLGIPCMATERKAIENYYTDRAVKLALGDSARALGPYEKLANHGWGKSHGFKIAALMTKEELLATDIGKFLVETLS